MPQRFIAYVLNKLILIIPVNCIYWLIYYCFDLRTYLEDSLGLNLILIFIYTLFLPSTGYAVLTEQGGINQTLDVGIEIGIVIISFIVIDAILSFLFQGDIGKRIIGLKVSRTDKSKMTFKRSFLRVSVKYISIAFFPIILIYPFFNKEHLTLHDKIAKTIVKETNP